MLNLTKKQRRSIARIVGMHHRGSRVAPVHEAINERAGWQQAMARAAEGGKVALCRSGMDCDCTQYRSVRIIDVPSSIFAFVREEHRNWLDGPESTWVDRPSENDEGYASADRAMEAYENGHPGTVYWGDL